MTEMPTIGIDVGATKLVAAVVDRDGRVLRRDTRTLTPSSSSSGLVDPLLRAVQTLRTEFEVAAIGVGTAGLVSWPAGEIEFAANHDHRRLKLRTHLAGRCGLPVVVENDANAAAWAEASTGKHLDKGVLFVAIGTGLGSGFIANGELMRGHHGRGAELGHVVVDRDSQRRCACGRTGCLEAFVSGTALANAGREMVAKDPRGRLAEWAKRERGVSTKLMINAAQHGYVEVLAEVRTMGTVLGQAVSDVMSLLPVDEVIVGGGLAALDRLLLDPMRSACQRHLSRSKYLSPPSIRLATHGPDATLVGAALLARRHAETAPTRVLAEVGG